MRQRLFAALLLSTLCGGARTVVAQQNDTRPAVRTINDKELDSLIHNRNGKVLFLNIWATWCQPCVEEFPDIVKLSGMYREEKIDFAAVSVDYPDELESKVRPFVAAHNVPFNVYVANVKKDEDLINEVNPSWSGAIPATVMFDAQGKRQVFMFGQSPLSVFKTKLDSVLHLKDF
ncbi:MAG TPA: TlpA disulfide reductase family protein [Bacteroidota bacterium]|nr:TlpA disulfide reductase family protein [Bacteroidota bacterium]